MTRSRTAAFAVGAVLLLAGCADTAEDATTDGGGPASATVTSEAEETDSHGGELPPAPLPQTTQPTRTASQSPASSRSPENLTLATMTVFVQDYPSADAWFDALAPFLSPQAREDWIGTDPAEVIGSTLVGQPAIVVANDYLTRTSMGTDAGVYELLLARADDGSWIVERIEPPAQPVVGG